MSHSDNRRMIIAISSSLLLVYLFSVAYAILTQKPLYADGSYFFLKILENESFKMDYPSRSYANVLSQLPVVLGIKLFHVSNVNALSCLFGIGYFLTPIICLSICYYIVRKINIRYMIFPLLSLFGVTYNILFSITTQSIVISCVFWPILFFVIFVREYKLFDLMLLMFTAFIFMRSYESAVIFGFILLIALFIEMAQNWSQASRTTKLIWILLALMMVNSIGIAAKAILRPNENKDDFLRDIPAVLHHYQAMLSVAYVALISVCLCVRPFGKSVYFKIVSALLLLVTLAFGILPLIQPEWIRAILQFQARSFHLYMIPCLGVIAWVVIKGRVRVSEQSWRRAFMLCAFLVIGQLTWHVSTTFQWNGFRQIFKEELSAKQGYVRLEETRLVHDHIGHQSVRGMAWDWTYPVLSILWSRNLEVTTIIANPKERRRWEPFHSRNIQELPKIEKFGFSYEKYIQYVQSTHTSE